MQDKEKDQKYKALQLTIDKLEKLTARVLL